MKRDAIQPGALLRHLRGRHPGQKIKVSRVGARMVEYTIPHGAGRSDKSAKHQIAIDFLLTNSEVA